jgi:2-dehydropantoate 2-reductase
MKSARIGIVGAGAVGCFYGARLAHAGYQVHFLMRRDLAAVRERGLTIRSDGRQLHLPNVNAYASTNEIGVCDVVIVAVKTTSNHFLPELLKPMVGEGTAILTLQNGLGNEDFFAGHFGPDRVMGGLCFVCLNRIDYGIVEHLGHGTISIGEFQGKPCSRTKAIVGALLEAGIEAKVVDDLMAERWRKLVWNVPFNGLSIVAGGITVDRIISDPGLLDLTVSLMREVTGAACAFGHDISDDFLESRIASTRLMGAYKPSSLLDYLAGHEVEVESIWGEPLRAAESRGVSTPRLRMLYTLLRQLTGNGRR